jgi:phenylacetate-coenzyme A ligase PaaK-like adenylate-forming protein
MMQATLREILNQQPAVEFDIVGYLLSTRYSIALTKRFAAFLEGMRAETGVNTKIRVAHAFESGELDCVPYYRKQRERGFSFDNLPLIAKSDIRERPEQFVSSAVSSSKVWRSKSHGTTGRPAYIFFSDEYYFDALCLPIRKAAAVFGLDEPFSNRVFAAGIGEAGDFAVLDPTNSVGPYVELRVDTANGKTISRAIDLIRQYRPVFVSSRPNLLLLLVEQLTSANLGDYKPVAVMSGGETLLPKLKAKIEHTFACPVINRYGMSEVGFIASECRHGYLHIDTSAHHVEIVSDSGRPVSDGIVGQIVISGIRNATMPLLRYNTGDIGALRREPCGCGSFSPRLVDFGGREIPNLSLPTGASFSPLILTGSLFDRFPEMEDFELLQEAEGTLVLSVELSEAASDPIESLQSIRKFVEARLPEGGITVHCRSVRLSRHGKRQRYKKAS